MLGGKTQYFAWPFFCRSLLTVPLSGLSELEGTTRSLGREETLLIYLIDLYLLVAFTRKQMRKVNSITNIRQTLV